MWLDRSIYQQLISLIPKKSLFNQHKLCDRRISSINEVKGAYESCLKSSTWCISRYVCSRHEFSELEFEIIANYNWMYITMAIFPSWSLLWCKEPLQSMRHSKIDSLFFASYLKYLRTKIVQKECNGKITYYFLSCF